MSYGLIVQPDGLLAVWSNNVDALVVWDATDEEFIAWRLDLAAERERESATWSIARVRAGKGPRWMPTYEEAVEQTRRRFPESAP